MARKDNKPGFVTNMPASAGLHGGGIKRKAQAEGYHVVSDAAALIGVSPDTLRRWRKEGVPKRPGKPPIPDNYMRMGTLKVVVYSDEDIEVLKAYISKSIA